MLGECVNQYTLNKSHITLTNQNHKLFKLNLLISFSLWKHYIIHGAVNFTLLLFINNLLAHKRDRLGIFPKVDILENSAYLVKKKQSFSYLLQVWSRQGG